MYDGFGNELDYDANNTNPFRFAGEYWDWSTQTYYLRARHFNPRTGRFTQADPFWNIGNMQSSNAAILQSGNLFAFKMNNPIRFIDPSGLVAVDILEFASLFSGSSVVFSSNNTSARVTWGSKAFSIHQHQMSFVNGRAVADAGLFINAFGVNTSTFHVFECSTTSNIVIRATFNISGTGADLVHGGSTYRELFLRGVEEWWIGSFGAHNVSTFARESSSGISVDIREAAGVSHAIIPFGFFGIGGWRPSNPGSIVMHTHTCYSRHNGGSRSAHWDFGWTSAHEFGHTMGLSDSSTGDLMGLPMRRATEDIIDALLRAHNNRRWQRLP